MGAGRLRRQGRLGAVGRTAASADRPWSLSPAALRAAPFTPRLVLPSPNGSAIATAAGDVTTVVAGCLRNAAAVGHWLTESGYGAADRPVAIVPSGERWPDGSLRPALEDLLGAGAIVAAIHGPQLSPEAAAARAAVEAAADLAATLRDCASGRELIAYGFPDDVPVLAGAGFSAA